MIYFWLHYSYRKKKKINSLLRTCTSVYWPWLCEISVISSILFQSVQWFFFFLRSNVLLSLKKFHYFLITWLSVTAGSIGLERISSVLLSKYCFLCTLSAQSCVSSDHAVYNPFLLSYPKYKLRPSLLYYWKFITEHLCCLRTDLSIISS